LEASGFVFATVTPRQVLKDAFAAKILKEGAVWMDMLDHRNLLSHSYDSTHFNMAVDAIHRRYLNALAELHEFLQREATS
ncbi:MAG: nucleotidyltransferase, partial [Proteobacteria bacterium]|nr:nucleotidyltransferase [Pseudomonadota bacterium]